MAVAWIKDRDAFDLDEWPEPDGTTDELQAFSQSLIDRDDIDDNEREAIESLWISLSTGLLDVWVKYNGRSEWRLLIWDTWRPDPQHTSSAEQDKPFQYQGAPISVGPFLGDKHSGNPCALRIPQRSLEQAYSGKNNIFHPALGSPERPGGPGYMSLYSAVFWIASECHTREFDPTDLPRWRRAFVKLINSVLDEGLTVKGRDANNPGGTLQKLANVEFDGLEMVLWFEFNKSIHSLSCRSELPDGDNQEIDLYHVCELQPPRQKPNSTKQNFSDRIRKGGNEKWLRLKVERNAVAKLWPPKTEVSESVPVSVGPSQQSAWTLGMAVRWIMCRNDNKAINDTVAQLLAEDWADDDNEVLKAGQLVTAYDAWTDLVNKLTDEEFAASAMDHSTHDTGVIAHTEWPHLHVALDNLNAPDDELRKLNGVAAYTNVRVLARDVRKLWPPIDKSNRKRGRKQKYDRDGAETECFRLLDHHGDFTAEDPAWDGQSKLEEALLQWFESKLGEDNAPAESTIRTYANDAYHKWKANQPKADN